MPTEGRRTVPTVATRRRQAARSGVPKQFRRRRDRVRPTSRAPVRTAGCPTAQAKEPSPGNRASPTPGGQARWTIASGQRAECRKEGIGRAAASYRPGTRRGKTSAPRGAPLLACAAAAARASMARQADCAAVTQPSRAPTDGVTCPADAHLPIGRIAPADDGSCRGHELTCTPARKQRMFGKQRRGPRALCGFCAVNGLPGNRCAPSRPPSDEANACAATSPRAIPKFRPAGLPARRAGLPTAPEQTNSQKHV
jgi:hypothetical protein